MSETLASEVQAWAELRGRIKTALLEKGVSVCDLVKELASLAGENSDRLSPQRVFPSYLSLLSVLAWWHDKGHLIGRSEFDALTESLAP